MSDEAEHLYERARALPSAERAAFVAEACLHRPALRDELLSLLESAEEGERFFERLGAAFFSPSDEQEFEPGYAVNQYRILEQVGRGGIGTVYRAYDTRLDRDVALKFLPHRPSGASSAPDRALAEARAAAAIEHPNVCTVYEIGEGEDGRPFIAMALHRGETLRERIGRGPLGPEEAVGIAKQVARGLRAAHERQIVHRDVKPENVVLGAEGTVKLLDFGLAGLARAGAERRGLTPGTLAYMSPEQCRGESVDHRTDLWSLGIVLYEMLAGARPFRGDSDGDVTAAICGAEPPSLAEARPGVPPLLARTVEHLLQKDPAARPAGIAEVELALDAAASGAAHRRAAGRIAAAGVLLIVSLAALFAWSSLRGGVAADEAGGTRTPDAPRATTGLAVLPLVNLGTDPADAILADAMTEELITRLGRSGRLRVVGSTSAFAFRGRPEDGRVVAERLGVRYLLEGGWQKDGSRLRVRIRLVDGEDGSTRWSEVYDREFVDVFAVQEDIARAVLEALDARLAGAPGVAGPPKAPASLAAYEAYVRGSDQALLRRDDGVREAIEHFRRAIAADSTYAPAWAGLSRLYLVQSGRPAADLPEAELIARADGAAARAIALDTALSEGYASRGLVRLFEWDLAGAEADLERSVKLDPTRALPRQWLAILHLQTGRPRSGLALAEAALENDPLSPSAHAEVAHGLIVNRRYDEALVQLRHIVGVDPPLLRVVPLRTLAYAGLGMWDEALEAATPLAGDRSAHPRALRGLVLGRAGRYDEARAVLAGLLEGWRDDEVAAYDVAIVFVGLGDHDRAFEWLDLAIEDRSIFPGQLHLMQPIFDDLRADPRFGVLMARLGIPTG